MCEEYEIHFLVDIERRKVFTKINTSKNNRNYYFVQIKPYEMKEVTVYNTNLDKPINSIDSRLSPELLQIIN